MRYVFSGFVICGAIAAFFGSPTAATAACSAATVKGGYATQLIGSVLSNNTFLPFAESGVIVADGNGKILSGSDTASLGGTLVARTLKGTYTVFRNCTINITLIDQGGTPYRFKGSILAGATEAVLIQADPNVVVTGTAKQLAQ